MKNSMNPLGQWAIISFFLKKKKKKKDESMGLRRDAVGLLYIYIWGCKALLMID